MLTVLGHYVLAILPIFLAVLLAGFLVAEVHIRRVRATLRR